MHPTRIPTNRFERGGCGFELANKAAMTYRKEPETGGNLPFKMNGPEYPRLRKLMKAHGADIQNVSYLTVYSEDPFFKRFKLHSLKIRITYIKRMSLRDNAAMMRK
jgi:hypothetical protein